MEQAWNRGWEGGSRGVQKSMQERWGIYVEKGSSWHAFCSCSWVVQDS